jgi:dihydropteroate synthase
MTQPASEPSAAPTWADLLPSGRPALMGILNVTPDSFSDGGRFQAPADAAARADRLIAEGADIVDLGGESTRPGAQATPVDDELARVLPALDHLASVGATVSIDTRNAAVMRAALGAGAGIVNDVSALRHDPDSLALAAAARAPVILMHMQGEPATMNDDPRYDDVVAEVAAWLAARAEACIAAGIEPERIALDPGLGFGKTYRQNLALLHGLDAIVALGYPVCLGASRKLAAWTAADSVRLAVSTTAAVIAASKGAALLRVHDVAETRAALRVAGLLPLG